jgi:hypothetical protein
LYFSLLHAEGYPPITFYATDTEGMHQACNKEINNETVIAKTPDFKV